MVYNHAMDNIIRFTLRIPDDLHLALKKAAAQECRSFHSQIMFLLRQALVGTDSPLRAK